MLIALTREPSPKLSEGEVTYIDRLPVDFELAKQQHRDYCAALAKCGAQVITLPTLVDYPDSVFVEDTMVVVDEVAVLCHAGAESRRDEIDYIRSEIAKFRPLIELAAPATMEGGDVFRVGKTIYVGRSTRTNDAGIEGLRAALTPYGYEVIAVNVHGALHLKTAATPLNDTTLVINPEWVDLAPLKHFDLICVPPTEAWSGNILKVGESVIIQSNAPQTAAMIAERGIHTEPVDISEFGKVEGSLTCMSVVFEAKS
jgi:dimethylargininase